MTTRPLPTPTADTDPFWEGCRAHRLVMPRCRSCDDLIWFPKEFCPACGGRELQWEQLSGTGTLYSYSEVARPASPAFPPSYVLALVDLVEGPRMMTHVLVGTGGDLRVGANVHVLFEDVDDEVSLPVFALD